jgi:hypothetical protein
LEWQVAQPATLPMTGFLNSVAPSSALLASAAADELHAVKTRIHSNGIPITKNFFPKLISVD